MSMRLATYCICAWFVGVVSVAQAANFTVTGTIKTANGTDPGDDRPAKRITYSVFESGSMFDTNCGGGFTDDQGAFTLAISTWYTVPDVYVRAEYAFAAPDNKLIHVRDFGDTMDLTYTWPTIIGISSPTTNLGVLHTPSNKPNIGSEAGDCLRWVKANTSGWWSMPNALYAYALPGSFTGMPYQSAGEIFIRMAEYDPPPSLIRFSAIHHETGHAVHYRAHGTDLPGPAILSHTAPMETNAGHALTEGFAEYLAECSAPHDTGNRLANNSRDWWRGETAYTGTDNSGDIVEGALWNAWSTLGDFSGTFKAICDKRPKDIREWLDQYISNNNTAPKIASVFTAIQGNGIVYTRGKISDFAPGLPPNSAPASTGNSKLIGQTVFLRGTVKPTIEQNTKTELNLATDLKPAVKKKLGYKTAISGDLEAYVAGAWTYLSETSWSSDISFDTAAVQDGDYDLIVKAQNEHGWWDNFQPEFLGDSDALNNTDEKWLKHLRTWFSTAGQAGVEAQGKVIIDNKPPDVLDDVFPPVN